MSNNRAEIKLEIFILVLLIAFSLFVSLANINFPPYKTFDELYRINRVEAFMKGEPFITPQPHFSRYIILIGILFFGDNTFGWRIMQALTGALLIPVGYLVSKTLFKHKYAGLITAFLITSELAYLVYSRIGVVSIFQVCFRAIAILFFILPTETANTTKSRFFYTISAITTGISLAIKWTALTLLPTFWLWQTINNNSKKTTGQKTTF